MDDRRTARPSPPLSEKERLSRIAKCEKMVLVVVGGERAFDKVQYRTLRLYLRQGVGPAPLICISHRLPLSISTSPTLKLRVRQAVHVVEDNET